MFYASSIILGVALIVSFYVIIRSQNTVTRLIVVDFVSLLLISWLITFYFYSPYSFVLDLAIMMALISVFTVIAIVDWLKPNKSSEP